MNILAVCSVINFRDFTRRATIEAIHRKVGTLDILLFISLLNIFKKKITVSDLKFHSYNFWIPDSFKYIRVLGLAEHLIKRVYWDRKFAKYDWIFLTDPNQAWLLPYINRSKILYLIRDANVLQNLSNKVSEREILDRADLILATSLNLADKYLTKYHHKKFSNIHYWPNCVDLNIWKPGLFTSNKSRKPRIGIAGNFGFKRTDYTLLETIATECSDFEFEIAGTLDYKRSREFWDKLLSRSNVKYLGNIPSEELPGTVAGWDVGLITDRMDEYSSFMHHNKVYQYLAMGIPVVSLKIHDDYSELYPFVRMADDHESYINEIKKALELSEDISFRNGCAELAGSNSSDIRALEFISIIQKI